jgi:hypothetical protein
MTSIPGNSNPNSNNHVVIQSSSNSLYLFPCTESELTNIVKKLPNKNSHGLGGIPGVVVKRSVLVIKDQVPFLINESLRLGVFPDSLKTAKVVPLYKGKGSKQDMNSYHPISLLNQLGKIFEKVFYNHLVSYLESFSLLSPSQNGFRKSKSTSTATFEMVTHVLSNLDNRLETLDFFFDFSKAFDLVHLLLLLKLGYYGIQGTPYKWIESYVSGNQHVVLCKNGIRFISPGKEIPLGVPQGSVLGPILFLLYINDLPGTLKSVTSVKLILNADDTKCHCVSPIIE